MGNIKRREFIKQCGIGAGALLTANVWSQALFADPVKGLTAPDYQQIFGITKEEMKKLLEIALSKGGDFSDLFFEYRLSTSLTYEEDIVKSSSENITLGVGIRVLNNDQTGYAYTNDLTFDKIKQTCLTAAAIASGSSKYKVANFNDLKVNTKLYDLGEPLSKLGLDDKIKLIKQGYDAAKNYDKKITKVSSFIADEIQIVTIANSEGVFITDVRPQARLSVVANAEENGNKSSGYKSAGGRIGYNFYKNESLPKNIGLEASKEAIILLEAKEAPGGEYPVVLKAGDSGVMIHEAVGHPLEGDSAWKKQTIMWDKVGEMVANPLLTIYDDATIPNYRGTMSVDDEGTKTENVVLIEKGKLIGFLNDKLAARMLKAKANGHGRRESYKNMPIPRMNNTVLANGTSEHDEILKDVKKGFYAISYQGGQVSNTGKFTFSVNLGYLIEDGKLTQPLKNCTLIGTNIQILKDVDMVGNDMGFFLGTCGKEGQSVPVTAGTPTLRIKKMTVGGVA